MEFISRRMVGRKKSLGIGASINGSTQHFITALEESEKLPKQLAEELWQLRPQPKRKHSLRPRYDETAYILGEEVPRQVMRQTNHVVKAIDDESREVKRTLKKEKEQGAIIPTFYKIGLFTKVIASLMLGGSFVVGALLPFYQGLSLMQVGEFLFNTGWGRLFLLIIGLSLVISELVDFSYKSKLCRQRIQTV